MMDTTCVQIASNVLLVLITCVYAFLTYKILVANKSSVDVAREALEEQRKQQAQNVGIQLYAHRARVVADIEANRSANALAEARILFGESVGELLDDLEGAEHERLSSQRRIDHFIDRVKQVDPNTYTRYENLRSFQALQRPSDALETSGEIDRVLGEVDLTIPVDDGSGVQRISYYELRSELDEKGRLASAARKQLADAMRTEIRKSIGLE